MPRKLYTDLTHADRLVAKLHRWAVGKPGYEKKLWSDLKEFMADDRRAKDLVIDSCQREIAALRDSLRQIAFPVDKLKQTSRETGIQLNGDMIVRLLDDPNHFREIARKALQ